MELHPSGRRIPCTRKWHLPGKVNDALCDISNIEQG